LSGSRDCVDSSSISVTAVRQAVLEMYGLIGKMTSKPGQRDALLALVLRGAENMPGCLSYIIAKDAGDENAVWITEVWEDEAHHQASLQLPSVRAAIATAMPLIAGMEPGVITNPVGGVGLPSGKD
jgi:quinol monooxygenase YgiN